MSTLHTTLTSAVDERKARLAKLASLKRKAPGSSTTISSETPTQPTESSSTLPSSAPHLSGRNYDPTLRAPRLGFDASSTLLAPDIPTVESQSTTLLSTTLQAAADEERKLQKSESDPSDLASGAGGGIDLFKLQPKKPNWDLKRELAERMRMWDVEGKTKGAVARIVRERVEGRRKVVEAERKEGQMEGVDGPKREREEDVDREGKGEGEGEEVGIEGAELVEGVHLREREEEEEERRERQLEQELEDEGIP